MNSDEIVEIVKIICTTGVAIAFMYFMFGSHKKKLIKK